MKSNSSTVLKKSIGLICALAVGAGTLAGCAGNKAATDNNAKGTTVSASKNMNESGLPIVKEKETFEIAVIQASPLKSADKKTAVIDTEKETNVAIKWLEIPNSAWQEKINIMFSTNSLPDAIIGESYISKNYTQLVELDGLIEKYAPSVQKLLKNRPEYVTALKAPDGKIHSLPNGDESFPNQIDAQLWMNTDWLKKVNKTMPKTTQEFYDVLVAFKNEDPNGNGQKDEIPFTFRNVWGWGTGMENVFGPFGVIENSAHVFMKDNKAVFSAQEKGYYDALVWLNKMYKEGLIDKESFTMSADQYNTRGAGKDVVGTHINYSGHFSGVNNGDGSRYQVVPVLKGPGGTQMVGANYILREGGFSITNSCKSPEVLLRWYDYINSSLELALKWGRGNKGEAWDIVKVNGVDRARLNVVNTDKIKKWGFDYKSASEYRNAESFGGQTPSLWQIDYEKNKVAPDDATVDYKRIGVEEAMPFAVYGLPVGSATPENSERRALLLTDIDNYLIKFISDSVINGIDDAKWKKHLDTLKTLKVDEYVKLCNEFVAGLK